MNENPDPLWDYELKHALHRNAEWGFLSESRPDTDGMYMPEFGPAPPHEHASLIAIKPVMEEKKNTYIAFKVERAGFIRDPGSSPKMHQSDGEKRGR